MRPTTRSAFLALALPFVTACGGDDPVSPVATLPVATADLTALADALAPIDTQQVLRAFGFAGVGRGLPFEPFMPMGGGPIEHVPVVARASAPAVARQVVTNPFAIPDSLRGRTYVQVSFGLRWALDTLADGRPRPGAPSDGVRFVLQEQYAALDSAPRVGYLDLRQQGTGTAMMLVADVYTLAGTQVMHYVGSQFSQGGEGWSAGPGLRVDQVTTTTSRGGTHTRWSAPAIALDATHDAAINSDVFTQTYTLTLDGKRLRLSSALGIDDFAVTYTVLSDDAPFARRRDVSFTPTPWRHVGSDRQLTAEEDAQVQALIHALAALPDAEAAWQQGVFALSSLRYPISR